MKFVDLKLSAPLSNEIQKGLVALGFETPTPIQALAIPVASEGSDLIAIAETGTGKTGAFSLPMLSRLMQKKDEIALVLAPTRELAIQIEEFVRKFTQFTPSLRSVNLVGGLAMGAQIRALQQRPRILIATPGRLIDHLERGSVRLEKVSMLVLDEADRMLDMGFQPQLERIERALPRNRQTLLFSATWGNEMDRLSARYLRSPKRVGAATQSKASHLIDQKVLHTLQPKKNETLLDELNRRAGPVLVFARTQARVDRVSKYLASYGVEASRIHGGRSQAQRNGALAAFKTGKTRFLIATDIAARGIDVTGIGHVINYDLPQVAEDYIHRIGRTGRNGMDGESVSFVTPEDKGTWREIIRLLQKSGSKLPEIIQAAAPSGTLPLATTGVVAAVPGSGDRPQAWNGAGSEGRDSSDRRDPRGGENRGPRGGRPNQGQHQNRGGQRRDDRGGNRDDSPRFDGRGPRRDGRGGTSQDQAAGRTGPRKSRVRRWGQPVQGNS